MRTELRNYVMFTAKLTRLFCAGTFEDPIVVKSAGPEYQVGCTGSPADSHVVKWLVVCSTLFNFVLAGTDSFKDSSRPPDHD